MKKAIVALLLAAVCALPFAGCESAKGPEVKALVSPQQLVAVGSGATVTAGKTTEGLFPQTGLTVEGGKDYSASLNGVFTGESRFEFAFLGQDPNGCDAGGENAADGWKQKEKGTSNTVGRGSFAFRIANAQDENEYFDIVYENENDWFMEAYVLYKDQVILSNGNYIYDSRPVEGQHGLHEGAFAMTYRKAGRAQRDTMFFEINWTGLQKDVLTVSVNTYYDEYVSLARFDGTDERQPDIMKGMLAFGLPKLSGMLQNGYTVSFTSDYESEFDDAHDGTDICFKRVENEETVTELTGTAQVEAPAWYRI